MTPQRLALLVVEGATSAGRNVATDLRALSAAAPSPLFVRAAALADAGQLPQALEGLGAPPLLARASGLWPTVVGPARVAVERLPSTRQLVFGLRLSGTLCLVLALVQVAVGALLAVRVLPAFVGLMGGGPPANPAVALAVLLPVQLVLWAGALGAVRWARAPWNRQLAFAAHAAVGAALVEAKAPAEVVTAWLASEPRLAFTNGRPARPDDLRALAEAWSARADASMRRFLADFRFLAIGLLVVEGAWMVRDVLVALSKLPGTYL